MMAFRVDSAQCKRKARKAELAWQVSRYLWRPPLNFKIFFSKPHFIIILSQKWRQISVRFFVYYLALKTYSVFLDSEETTHNAEKNDTKKIDFFFQKTSKWPTQKKVISPLPQFFRILKKTSFHLLCTRL